MTSLDLETAHAVPIKCNGISNRLATLGYPESFDDETVRRALFALRRRLVRFFRDNVIACEGDAADYLFLLVSGVVRSCKRFQNGDRNIIAFYLPGDMFGWSESGHAFSVEAASYAMVLFLKRITLYFIASRESRMANFLLAATTNELRRAQRHALLIGQSANSRVAMFLTELWVRLGKGNYVDLPMSHQDIADHLGLTIETLSRTITGMERSGIITRISTRRLLLRNQPSLVHMMQ